MAVTALKDGFPLGQYKWQYPVDPDIAFSVDVAKLETYTYTETIHPPIALPAAPVKVGNPWLARRTALAYVNTARAALGWPELKRLPSGQPGSGSHCVLARALPDCIGVAGDVRFRSEKTAATVAAVWATDAFGPCVKLPAGLAEFIWHFDNRHYRDLIVY